MTPAPAIVNNNSRNPLWTPKIEDIRKSSINLFINHINQKYNLSNIFICPFIINVYYCYYLTILDIKDYWNLYSWSVENIRKFWKEIWDFCGIQGSVKIKENEIDRTAVVGEDKDEDFLILEKFEKMDEFPKWFQNKKLNFAKNLLYPAHPHDNSIAIYFRSELDQLSRSITWKDLREQVQVAIRVLKKNFGVVKGDRIGAYSHNCPEVLIYMLAGAALGAIFTSGSPDFGPKV